MKVIYICHCKYFKLVVEKGDVTTFEKKGGGIGEEVLLKGTGEFYTKDREMYTRETDNLQKAKWEGVLQLDRV